MRKTQRAGTTEDPHRAQLRYGPTRMCSLHLDSTSPAFAGQAASLTAHIAFSTLLHSFLHCGVLVTYSRPGRWCRSWSMPSSAVAACPAASGSYARQPDNRQRAQVAPLHGLQIGAATRGETGDNCLLWSLFCPLGGCSQRIDAAPASVGKYEPVS